MKETITMKTLESDWDRLEKMSDEDIDYSDIPPLDEDFFANAMVYISPVQRKNYVHLDTDIATWFRSQTDESRRLINLVLRKYMEVHQELNTEY